jgi:hypothetical protein
MSNARPQPDIYSAKKLGNNDNYNTVIYTKGGHAATTTTDQFGMIGIK